MNCIACNPAVTYLNLSVVVTFMSLLLTGDEDHRGGWVAGSGLVERSDLDGVNLSTAYWG